MAINNLAIASGGETKFSTCSQKIVDLTANTPIPILPLAENRAYVCISNISDSEVFIILGDADSQSLGKGIYLRGKASSFEINSSNLYTGKISAISQSPTRLSICSCVS